MQYYFVQNMEVRTMFWNDQSVIFFFFFFKKHKKQNLVEAKYRTGPLAKIKSECTDGRTDARKTMF
jgi:hypothetical protein